MASDEDRKRLKKLYKDQQKAEARQYMILTAEQLNNLLEYLEEQLERIDCDHSHHLTRRWAKENGIDEEQLIASMSHFGGFCDCEVLMNLEPDSIF